MSVGQATAPIVHSVHFYDHDEALISRMRGIVSLGLHAGNSVLIVATEDHRMQLIKELEKWYVNVQPALRNGHLTMLDAEETLASFMQDGHINREKLEDSARQLIVNAKDNARNAERGLTVFGEMVAILWAQGNHAAALQLEAKWNELMQGETFHLHCAYPRAAVSGDGFGWEHICNHHTDVIMSRA